MSVVWQMQQQTIKTREIPVFDIDLDQSPETRWREVALHYKDYFPGLV